MKLPAASSAAAVLSTAAAQINSTLAPLTFDPLPLGSIKPQGWLWDQLQLMADGLAGHEHDFYEYVANSSWLGGTMEYSYLNEGFPYWFNGLVPLAYGLDDERLKSQVQTTVENVLASQSQDGWLGPEVGNARNLWARYPFILGLTQLMEADPTYIENVLPALYKFIDLMHSMLADNYTGYLYQEGDVVSQDDTAWGRVRVQDLLISLAWVYEKHPPSNATVILDSAQYLINGMLDWAYWYQEGVYIKQDLNTVPELAVSNPLYPYQHGVNTGQGLKATAVVNRFTHNETLLDVARLGVNWTFTYHAAASGAILADERLAGLAPYYGSETCTLAETMYSLSYLYQALGDNYFADQCEKVAFNALPVQLTPDWWARQYVAEPNQPYSDKLSETPFYNVNVWGQSYGLETDYPCCTVNHPQGYPKFLSAAFVTAGDNGLAHALLGPVSITTTLGNNSVAVNCSTNYPFDGLLSYSISSSAPFDFYVRVPEWADLASSTIGSSDASSALAPDSHTGLHKISISSGSTSLTYTLNTSIIIENRANDTVAVHYGALLYALQIGQTNTSTLPLNYQNNSEYSSTYAPPQSRQYEIVNTTAWNVAIDPSTLAFHSSQLPAGSALPNPIWAPDAPPTWMTVQACEIEWGLYHGVPDSPPLKADRACLGDAFEAKLVPYASAKLHMLDLPTVDLSGS